MNSKQTAPFLITLAPLAAVAPPLIIGGIIAGATILVFKSLFPDKKEKPETVPAIKPEIQRKPVETAVFDQIPAENPAKLAVMPRPAIPHPIVPPPAAPKITAPVAVIVPKIAAQIPPPVKKKFVTRTDLANVFQHGARTLTRTAAVTALKTLGFGKTAAYSALSPDGRFSAWLECAPDGIITWKA